LGDYRPRPELYGAGLASSLVTSLGAVFVLTALMFRSVTAGLINIIPNMGACLVASMTILPMLLNIFKPRFVYGK
jgi:predicted RND superfamily exporter protein